MKLTVLLMTVICLQAYSSGFSQEKFTLLLENVKIKKALKAIEQAGNCRFIYNDGLFSEDIRLNVRAVDETLTQVLDKTFAETRLTYKILDNNLVAIGVGDPLQDIQLTGQITDSSGIPVMGVSVKIKGSAKGTSTDINGRYEIRVAEGEILVFSHIGFETREIVVKGQAVLNVTLKEHSSGLNEVVVVGYGTEKKVNLTGAIETVDVEGFDSRPLTNASMALQGKVAGAFISQNSGQPGYDDAAILIRGVGTFNNTAPLVIIDGVEASLSDVNPQDIATVSILKDASSSAIYGNRAANGVILITTKRGRVDQMKVEYTAYYGRQKVTTMPATLKGLQYLDLSAQAYYNTNGSYPAWYNDAYMNNYRNNVDPVMYPLNFNWSDFLLQTAAMQSHHVSVSGGTKDVQYMTSIGWLDQDGVAIGNNTKKLTFRSNLNTHFLKDHLQIQIQASGHEQTTDDLVNGMSSAFYYAYVVPPTTSMKIPGLGYSNYGYSYGARDAGGFNTIKSGPLNLSGLVSINHLLKGLSLNAFYNIEKSYSQQEIFRPTVQLFSLNEDGSVSLPTPAVSNLSFQRSEDLTTTFNTYANYESSFGGGHNVSGMVGFEARKDQATSFSLSRNNLSVNLPLLSFGDPSTQLNNSDASTVSWLSQFARFNYNYKSRYLFEANIRNDGSSRFLNKYGVFPSLSAGWRASEEDFLKSVNWINNWKFRASWGRLGNESIGQAYAASDQLSLNLQTDFNDQLYSAGAVSVLANRNTTWETSEMTNYGMDFQVLANALSGSVDYFVKKTSGILMQVPVSSTLGLTTLPFQNIGKMNNKGIELSLKYNGKIGKTGFNIGVMASHVRNKIISLGGLNPIINGSLIEKEGSSFNSFYGFQTEGIYQSQAEIDNHLVNRDANGNTVNSYDGLIAQPGDIRFKDQINVDTRGNGKPDSRNGIIDANDMTVIGNSYPQWTFSSNLGCNWNGFDLNLLFQGVQGINSLNEGFLTIPFFGGSANTGAWYLNAWTPDKPSKTIQRVYSDPSRASIVSSYYLEDASYLRLKNIELGYTIPVKWIRSVGLNTHSAGFRVYGNVQNAFTWTKMRYGFDPEKPSTTTNTLQYPQIIIYSMGISVNF